MLLNALCYTLSYATYFLALRLLAYYTSLVLDLKDSITTNTPASKQLCICSYITSSRSFKCYGLGGPELSQIKKARHLRMWLTKRYPRRHTLLCGFKEQKLSKKKGP